MGLPLSRGNSVRNETYNSSVIGDTVKIPKNKHQGFYKSLFSHLRKYNTFLLHKSAEAFVIRACIPKYKGFLKKRKMLSKRPFTMSRVF